MKILVTGGLGFIGSNFVRYWYDRHPNDEIVIFDAQTYAARPEYLKDILSDPGNKTVSLITGDVMVPEFVQRAIQDVDGVFHFAAETHVCRSIEGPKKFFNSNTRGTWVLMEELRKIGFKGRFHHVSTDEVFGSLKLGGTDKFHEELPYRATSPYAASKAASDQIVMAYVHTYGLDATISNCSNNFGPNQNEEKLIPRTIHHAIEGNPIVVHGKGDHVRDWLWVGDHCSAIETIYRRAPKGSRFCVGGENERTNLQVIDDVRVNLPHVLEKMNVPLMKTKFELLFTDDRPTDDERYAIDNTRLRALGWKPSTDYHDKLRSTIAHYVDRILEQRGRTAAAR